MHDGVNHNEEALAALESAWYEVIDAVMSGRTAQLPCPECQADGLRVEEQGDRITVTCPSCTRSVEFQNQSA
jgi:endogenous inhibitor of DNA gyrase (YacG/DUF329 family)